MARRGHRLQNLVKRTSRTICIVCNFDYVGWTIGRDDKELTLAQTRGFEICEGRTKVLHNFFG